MEVVDENTTVNLLLRNVKDEKKDTERLQKNVLSLSGNKKLSRRKLALLILYAEKVPLAV